jgi:hypothetical protein
VSPIAVLQLRFASEVQFERAITARVGDLTIVSYSVVTPVHPQYRSQQGLRLGPQQGLPRMTLADEAVSGERSRRIVVRTLDATPLPPARTTRSSSFSAPTSAGSTSRACRPSSIPTCRACSSPASSAAWA